MNAAADDFTYLQGGRDAGDLEAEAQEPDQLGNATLASRTGNGWGDGNATLTSGTGDNWGGGNAKVALQESSFNHAEGSSSVHDGWS